MKLKPEVEEILSSKNQLQKLYDETGTVKKLAEVLSVSGRTVSKYMKRHGLSGTYGISPETRETLMSKRQLYEMYVECGYNSNAVAEKLGVSSLTVTRYMTQHEIMKTRGIPHSTIDILNDREELKSLYEKHGSTVKISEILGTTSGTVIRYMKMHGMNPTNGVSKNSFDVLGDKRKLEKLYDELGSIVLISERLGVSDRTVGHHMERMGIERDRWKPSPDAKRVLEDKARLTSMYETHRNTTSMAEELGVWPHTVRKYMNLHDIDRKYSVSSLEKSMEEFLDSIGVDYVRNDRSVLNGKEMDFFIPSKMVGIEMNGLYWHSEEFLHKSFHLDKTKLANEKGIRLVHIFEDEWNQRRSQFIEKLLSILGMDKRRKIGGRETKCSVAPPTSLRSLMDESHIQGFSGGCFAVSLEYEGETIAGAIFRKDPSNSSKVHLNRFASVARVQGGLSKIMKFSMPKLRNMGFIEVVSFADRAHSDGGLYESSGWVFDGHTPPDYRYVVGKNRTRKQNFRRSALYEKLGELYDPLLSERENMKNAGIPRIYDCGLARYVMKL